MSSYNLFASMTAPLPYPHCTKIEVGEAHVVTSPDRILKVDDIIYANDGGRELEPKRKVLRILEQRPARGQHSVDFAPIFQRVQVRTV